MPSPPPPPPPAAVSLAGPPTVPLKGVRPSFSAFYLQREVAQALRETSGAVVVVEDEAPEPLAKLPVLLRLEHLNVRFLGAAGTWKPHLNCHGPAFVDSSTVFEQRGGIQAKSYPIGWGFN